MFDSMKPMVLTGTVYLEIPIQWESNPDYPPRPPLQQVLEDIVAKAISKAEGVRLNDLCVEAREVELQEPGPVAAVEQAPHA